MRFEVTFEGRIVDGTGKAVDADTLEQHLDNVMSELLAIGAVDPAIGAAGDGSVDISVVVEADSFDDALPAGSNVIRTAVHAAGGHTPGWAIDWVSGKATRRALVDA